MCQRLSERWWRASSPRGSGPPPHPRTAADAYFGPLVKWDTSAVTHMDHLCVGAAAGSRAAAADGSWRQV